MNFLPSEVYFVNDPNTDVKIVNAARVSFNKRVDIIEAKDAKLIRYLNTHKHWTPFAHNIFTFALDAAPFKNVELLLKVANTPGSVWTYQEVSNTFLVTASLWWWSEHILLIAPAVNGKCFVNKLKEYCPVAFAELMGDIEQVILEYKNDKFGVTGEQENAKHLFVTLGFKVPIYIDRQLMKHSVGFVRNEVSRRYVDTTPEMHMIDAWRGKPVNAKQGSSDTTVSLVKCGTMGLTAVFPGEAYRTNCENTVAWYDDYIASGVAPEQARSLLPLASMTEYYLTGSLSSYARLVALRTEPHAQKEAQEVATHIDVILNELQPKLWPKALNEARQIFI